MSNPTTRSFIQASSLQCPRAEEKKGIRSMDFHQKSFLTTEMMQKVCHFFINFPLDTQRGRNAASFKVYKTSEKVLKTKALKTLPKPIQRLWINNTLSYHASQCKNYGFFKVIRVLRHTLGRWRDILHLGYCSTVTGVRNMLPTSVGF